MKYLTLLIFLTLNSCISASIPKGHAGKIEVKENNKYITYYIPENYIAVSDSSSEEIFMNHDKFKNISTYTNKEFFKKIVYTNFSSDWNIKESVQVYYQKSANEQFCYFDFLYKERNWLFFDKVILLNEKNQKKEIAIDRPYINKKEKVSQYSAMAIETAQKKIPEYTRKEMIEFFKNSQSVDARFYGDGYKDYKLSDEQRQAILSILILPDTLNKI